MFIFNHFTRATTLRLTLFSGLCFIIVTLIYIGVAPSIEIQRKQAELAQFKEIAHNLNVNDSILETAKAETLNGNPVVVYKLMNQGVLSAYFIKATTNKGYSGKITLLIGMSPDRKTILGARVLEHHETPGLGDKIETRVSNWIHAFDNQRLGAKRLSVKKDGGDIDAFTGATITPRAVTNLIAKTVKDWQQETNND